MNEDPEAIRGGYAALRGQLKSTMREQLTLLRKEIAREQIEFEGRDQKVATVSGLLGISPAELGFRKRRPTR